MKRLETSASKHSVLIGKTLAGAFIFYTTLAISALADIAGEVDPLFSSYNSPSKPGASVLVVQNGRIAYEKGYGQARLNPKTPASELTNYRLASVSKAFAAMSILILKEAGALRLDETVTDVFSDFPSYGKEITIRHLLNHQSGLRDYEGLISGSEPSQINDEDVLRILKRQTSTQFTPGSRYSYSNGGYCLLGQIVAKRSGQKFHDFVRDHIFAPLWMSNSRVYDRDNVGEIPYRAYGHSGTSETDQSQTSATQGDGGVYTSAREYFYWDQAWVSPLLVSAESLKEALTPGKLNNGSSTSYGFGWMLDTYQGARREHHTGSTIGFRTAVQRIPSKNITVAVLINRAESSPWDIASQILDRLAFTDKSWGRWASPLGHFVGLEDTPF